MSQVVRYSRWAAIGAATIGYALLAHYTNTRAHAETLGTLLALAPVMLAALSLAWHSPHRVALLIACAIVGTGLVMEWSTLTQHFHRIYWLEHASTQLLLCFMFARTLRAGRVPLCTYFARLVHGTLTLPIEQYTRQVTAAWSIFFGSMAATSTLIFFTAPLQAWSIFANFFTAPLIVCMFIFEYLVRRYRHPDMKHAHIIAAAKAFWDAPAR